MFPQLNDAQQCRLYLYHRMQALLSLPNDVQPRMHYRGSLSAHPSGGHLLQLLFSHPNDDGSDLLDLQLAFSPPNDVLLFLLSSHRNDVPHDDLLL